MKISGLTSLVFAVLSLLACEARSYGQLYRGASNPYSKSAGGIFSSSAGNGYDRSGAGGFNQIPLLVKSVVYGTGKSTEYGKKAWTPGQANNYMTGGAAGYYRYIPTKGSPIAIIGAISPDGPRKAFERWAIAANGVDAERKQAELQRSLTNPAPAKIGSGAALNAIVDGLEPLAAKLKAMPPNAIDDHFLTRLNFTRGTGSVGMLRNKGKIEWSALLVNLTPKDESAKLRQQIETRFQDAYNQVAAGRPADADNLKTLAQALEQLGILATARAPTLAFAENVEMKKFLSALEDSVAFLKQADAADWLPGTAKAQANSIQELVLRMLEKKVRFATAAPGQEGANATMHRALTALYKQAAAPQVGAKSN